MRLLHRVLAAAVCIVAVSLVPTGWAQGGVDLEDDVGPLCLLSLHAYGLYFPNGVAGVDDRGRDTTTYESSGGFGVDLAWGRFPAFDRLGVQLGLRSEWIQAEEVTPLYGGYYGIYRRDATLKAVEPHFGIGVPIRAGLRTAIRVSGQLGYRFFDDNESLGGVSFSVEGCWDRTLKKHPRTHLDIFARTSITPTSAAGESQFLLAFGIGLSWQH